MASALPVWAGPDTANTGSPKARDSAAASNVGDLCTIKHGAHGVIEVQIGAPADVVWQVLTSFSSYPVVFKRIKSCRITKREGDLVFTETYLKPHLFLNQPCQHAVNDLTGAPHVLTWRALDGNFKAMGGKWELKPAKSGDGCIAKYTLEVDAGGCMPAPIVGIALRGMQREIVTSLKESAEHEYRSDHARTSKLPTTKPSQDNG
jgi:ribosome-associated toxin RatA of RatAB toxin-antitoxin module